MKVNFMIIGAMKSGTTTLSELLRRHPDVELFEREIQFFSSTRDWRKNLDRYHGLFEQADGKVYGDASTHYAYYPEFNLEIWDDIFEYNPEMKFIYVIRNPVDRSLSQYMHMYERGYTSLSLEEAIRKESTIINNSRYYTQIEPFIKRFTSRQILILEFDDLTKDTSTVLRQVSEFLGLDSQKFASLEAVHANVTVGGGKWHHKYDQLKKRLNILRRFFPRTFRNRVWDIVTGRKKRAFSRKPELTPELKNVIINLTRLDVLEIEKLTNRDLQKWLR